MDSRLNSQQSPYYLVAIPATQVEIGNRESIHWPQHQDQGICQPLQDRDWDFEQGHKITVIIFWYGLWHQHFNTFVYHHSYS